MMSALRTALSKSNTQTIVALSLTAVVSVLALTDRVPVELLFGQYAGIIGFLYGRSTS